MQAEVFCKAAKNGDLAQFRDSIGAGISLNCTNEVQNRLCRNSYDHDYYHVTSSYLSLSLYHSFFSLTTSLSYQYFRTIISSLSHLFLSSNLSLLPHRIYLSFSLCTCGTEVPSFSQSLFDNLKSFSI